MKSFNNYKTMNIKAKLKEARLKSNLSQERLGDKIEVRHNTISAWEKGKGLPKQLETFRKFCLATNSDPRDILGL